MFDALSGHSVQNGFLKSGQQPRLEKLEDRDVPAVISGCVYQDTNRNGIRDPGEMGIANNTIQLFDSNNRVVATAVTDSMGMYSFTRRSGTNPGPAQASHEVTFQQARTNVLRSGTLPLFDPSLGQLTKVEIIAEGGFQSNVVLENLEGTSAEMDAELKGSIRYQVGSTTIQATPERTLTDTLGAFDGTPDLQGTSAKDFGVTQLQGSFQTVTLTNPGDISGFVGQGTIGVTQNANMNACACGTGNLMAMIRSTAQGRVRVVYHYQPGNEIGPGTYKIVQVNQPPGYTDGFETRGNQTPIPNSNRTDFINVGVVNVNDVVSENCFGEIRASSVAGKVYVDNDRSTRFSTGDTAIAGVTLTLRGTDIFGRSIVRTTTTDASGNYRFGGLAAGSYTITETQPGSYQQGSNNAGSAGGTVAGDSIALRLGQAVNAINYNFGEVLSTPGGGGSNTSDSLAGKGWFVALGTKTWTW